MTLAAERKSNERNLTEVTPIAPERTTSTGSTRAHAIALRKARQRRMIKGLALFVLLPTLLGAIYFMAVASDQYESVATFTVQSSESRPSLGMEGFLAGLASVGGGGHDALVVRDYILSRDMLQRLDKERGFIAHYKAPSADWLSRLRASATFEEAYEYFKHKVYADYDQASGAMTVRVRAFDSATSTQLTEAILAYSEEMVNKLSDRERRDRTAYAENELNKAEERLTKARKELVALQQKHADFNPMQSATAAMTIRTQIEGELVKARAELMQLKSFMQDEAPQVRAVNERIKSLSAQAAGESRKLVDPKERGINTSMPDFEAAMVAKEFAQKAYESTMATLELARADAGRQHRYVAIVAAPSKPDEATYPHRLRGIVTVFVSSFLILAILTLIVAAVREHARL